MCANFQPIRRSNNPWVKQHFGTDLPDEGWHGDVYPNQHAPFIYLVDGKPKCELAGFGLKPYWAIHKPNAGKSTYNARSETVAIRNSFRSAWKECRFGMVLMESFYEPNYEVRDDDKSVRYSIKRSDGQPEAAACIYERVIDRNSGEVVFTFSMLTINANNHPVMKHFHKLGDEKRSIVILQDSDYDNWLHADSEQARDLLQLAPDSFLTSAPFPRS